MSATTFPSSRVEKKMKSGRTILYWSSIKVGDAERGLPRLLGIAIPEAEILALRFGLYNGNLPFVQIPLGSCRSRRREDGSCRSASPFPCPSRVPW